MRTKRWAAARKDALNLLVPLSAVAPATRRRQWKRLRGEAQTLLARAAGDWDESLHPRDEDGKFAGGGGGGGGGGSSESGTSRAEGSGKGGVVARGGPATDKKAAEWEKTTPYNERADIIRTAPDDQKPFAARNAEIGKLTGAEWQDPGPKPVKSLDDKLATGRAPNTITDAVRGGYMVQMPDQAEAILNELAKTYEVADQGWQTTKAGYFDRKFLVKLPSNAVAEIQIWHPLMWDAKEKQGGHDTYKKWKALPDQESPEGKQMQAQMNALYQGVREKLPKEWQMI